ncbi:predicted protein [Plenodomus lingam JN3]|uniref:Predicted protein n=1 Tax=Leptosphaeria maculans (strain JN3 / isolate v23.1.3 / race Av1-4-5-6-7-8) TaxID=985895 RepID=E5AF77_LEPMJ|nr:predicted protein [Plenodomus lingam JN3]CBY01866.1 predicted protein [Plenodomus lingam JN3]
MSAVPYARMPAPEYTEDEHAIPCRQWPQQVVKLEQDLLFLPRTLAVCEAYRASDALCALAEAAHEAMRVSGAYKRTSSCQRLTTSLVLFEHR